MYENSFSSAKFGPRKYLQADTTVIKKADGGTKTTSIR